jgi:F420-dependent oxidoreductase-like protein
MRYGVKHSGQDIPIAELRDIWRIVDEAHFDHLWNFDHLAAIGDEGPDRPVFEGWTIQAAMAQATQHVRIGAMVTGNTYRHPALLAKMAATVDHLSNGRLEFGIGAAWAEVEHEMYGFDGLDHRVGRLSEALQIIKSLWTQQSTTFDGRYYHLKDAVFNPKPVQKPHPPIWIGAGGDTTLRLVARHADVWNAVSAEPEETRPMLEKLDAACVSVGRDPMEVRRSFQFRWDGESTDEVVAKCGAMAELGFTEQVIYLFGPHPTRSAEKLANLLPELRREQRVAS